MSVLRAVMMTFLISLLSRHVGCQGTSSVPDNVDTTAQNQSNPQIQNEHQHLQPPTGSTASFPPESQSQPDQPAPENTIMGGTFVPSCHIACELVDSMDNLPQNTGAAAGIKTFSSINPALETLQVIDPLDRYAARRRFGPYWNRFDRFGLGAYRHPRFRRSFIPYPLFDETVDETADDLPADDMAVFVQPSNMPQPQSETTRTLGAEPKLFKCQKVCS